MQRQNSGARLRTVPMTKHTTRLRSGRRQTLSCSPISLSLSPLLPSSKTVGITRSNNK
uniref:Uncharacterized protein n=1 Tax=Nelumbo nucifera TaxID=4432 RepID=A0A822YRD3_NELNU|nr:TPA_asm: hypothetical protein HUJ06_005822 [Nelumbo nucifera]